MTKKTFFDPYRYELHVKIWIKHELSKNMRFLVKILHSELL